MPKIDIPTKRLIQTCPGDWIRAILPECEGASFSELKTEKLPKVESRLDSLFWIEDKDDRFILNIEPQGYLDPAMPARMLRYRSDVWEYTISKGLMTPSIKQAVIFFYPQHDNRKNRLNDSWGQKNTLDFEYQVIKVWEMDKQSVIDRELVGLYPLLPLMKQSEKDTPDTIIESTLRIIDTVEEPHLKADLMAVTSILASERFSSELIRKYIRREMLMESPLFEEWVEEERKEATMKNIQENIIELLAERFDLVSKSIRDKVSKVSDEEILRGLFRKAVKIDSLEKFEKLLDKALS